jgi:predicted DNA-binding transcriptional regulator YafY
MQRSRLLEIVYLLLDKKSITANELATHFEVSKRTILRDIEILTTARIPIYTSQGKGGGISILDNFVLNKSTVSAEEQNQILLALQSLSSTQQINATDLLSKLSALFETTDTNWIEVDFSRWGNTEPDKEKFEMLKTAILKKQAISFSYPSSYGETTSRTVYPLKLVFKSRAWYLQAYCLLKNDYRIFKINRILSAEVLTDSFASRHFIPRLIEPPDSIPPALIHLQLKFAPSVAYRVYDEFDMKYIAKNDDGSFTVNVDLPNDYWLYGFLLSFGTAVQVITPEDVKDSLLEQIDEIKNLYFNIKT